MHVASSYHLWIAQLQRQKTAYPFSEVPVVEWGRSLGCPEAATRNTIRKKKKKHASSWKSLWAYLNNSPWQWHINTPPVNNSSHLRPSTVLNSKSDKLRCLQLPEGVGWERAYMYFMGIMGTVSSWTGQVPLKGGSHYSALSHCFCLQCRPKIAWSSNDSREAKNHDLFCEIIQGLNVGYIFLMICRPRETNLRAGIWSLNYKFVTNNPLPTFFGALIILLIYNAYLHL